MKDFYKPFSNGSMYDRDKKKSSKPSGDIEGVTQCPIVMTKYGEHRISRDFDRVIADLLDGKADALVLYDQKNQEERDRQKLDQFRAGSNKT